MKKRNKKEKRRGAAEPTMEGMNHLHRSRLPLNNKVKKRAAGGLKNVAKKESLLHGRSGNACAVLGLIREVRKIIIYMVEKANKRSRNWGKK